MTERSPERSDGRSEGVLLEMKRGNETGYVKRDDVVLGLGL